MQDNLQPGAIIPLQTSFYKNFKLSSVQYSNVTLGPNVFTELYFDLPPGVYNQYDTSFSFIINDPQPIVAIANNDIVVLKNDFFPFLQRVQIYQSTSQYLVFIDDVHLYSKMVSRAELKSDERKQFMDYHNVPSTRTILASNLGTPKANNDSALDQSQLYSYPSIQYGTGSSFSPSYLYYNSKGASNTIQDIYVNVHLRDILPNTFLCIDKNIYISETMRFVFRFNSIEHIGGVQRANGSYDYFNSCNLNNIVLNINEECNEFLRQEAMRTNQEFVVPFVYSNQENFAPASSQQSSYSIQAVDESSFYKLYYSLFNTNTLDDVSSDLKFMLLDSNNDDNWNNYITGINNLKVKNNKFSRLQIYLNSLRYKELRMDNNDFYRYVCDKFKNNSYETYSDYLNNPVCCEIFDSQDIHNAEYDGVTVRGIPFGEQIGKNSLYFTYIWDTNPNQTQSMLHYTYYVVLKKCALVDGVYRLAM